MITSSIDPNISMRELLVKLPGAQRALFRHYHIGGCASCGFRPDETLAEVCARNAGLPVDKVIACLLASHEEDSKMLMEPGELAAMRDSGQTVQIVDIRSRDEFDTARIEGATLFTQELMQTILGNWDREALLVIVDHEGKRCLDAAAFFAGHGFNQVKGLRGGIDAWSAEADPTVPRYELEQQI